MAPYSPGNLTSPDEISRSKTKYAKWRTITIPLLASFLVIFKVVNEVNSSEENPNHDQLSIEKLNCSGMNEGTHTHTHINEFSSRSHAY